MIKKLIFVLGFLSVLTTGCAGTIALENIAKETAATAHESTVTENIADQEATSPVTHFYVRAWEEFLMLSNDDEVSGNRIVNARYIFVDLDDDSELEMIAYKEIRAEDSFVSVPFMTVFDAEGERETAVPLTRVFSQQWV